MVGWVSGHAFSQLYLKELVSCWQDWHLASFRQPSVCWRPSQLASVQILTFRRPLTKSGGRVSQGFLNWMNCSSRKVSEDQVTVCSNRMWDNCGHAGHQETSRVFVFVFLLRGDKEEGDICLFIHTQDCICDQNIRLLSLKEHLTA